MSDKTTKNWKKFKEETEASIFEEVDLDENEIDESAPEEDHPGLDHPSYLALEEKLTLAEQKAHENWEKAVRAKAEYENLERRSQREISSAHQFGTEKLISSLLPVFDSLDQALQLADQQEDKGLHEGLVLTMKLFQDAFEKVNVRLLDPQGETFNPQQHEAMSIQPATNVEPNTILAVFQKGCLLNDRLIRPARVIVAKGDK